MDVMNALEMYEMMNRRQFSRDFASRLLMEHLEVLSRFLKDEEPLDVFCGFEDTGRGSGHSLAAAITPARLVIAAHDVREDRVWEIRFRDVIRTDFTEHGLNLETEKGTARIRVNDVNGERLVHLIRQLTGETKKETV